MDWSEVTTRTVKSFDSSDLLECISDALHAKRLQKELREAARLCVYELSHRVARNYRAVTSAIARLEKEGVV
jgi:predicted transcriptional regulator